MVEPLIEDEEKIDDDTKVPLYNLERDVKANIIILQPSGSKSEVVMAGFSAEVHDEIFKGQFPDQRVSVEKLLHMKYRRSIWEEPSIRGMVRYIHVPCNNMSVSIPLN
jgi:hypothetical protein